MINRNLTRRLERLEAELAPADDSDVLRIRLTRIGEPVKVMEFRVPRPTGRQGRPWPRNGGRAR